MLRLAQKAFYPGPDPVPAPARRHDLQVPRDDRVPRPDGQGGRRAADRPHQRGGDRRRHAAVQGRHAALLRPAEDARRCSTRSQAGNFDAAFGGARRDEERSRAKERIFSVRDPNGQWDPKRQRPELWNLLNARLRPGESIRVFPLSNWTEIDVWQYIHVENDPDRAALLRQGARGDRPRRLADRRRSSRSCVTMPGEKPQMVKCRMRSLGCSPCTGAVRSDADTVPKIIEELICDAAVRAPAPHHRPRPGRLDGAEEARGLLLMSRLCCASARPAAWTTGRAR